MRPQLVTINSRKYDQSIRKSWTCELIERTDSLLIFGGEFDRDIFHPGLGDIKRGTISYEYYWLDRWYNVFRFHEPDGSFRNYYCNISMPPVFEKGVLDYTDLDIDVTVWPGFVYEILDEVEHEENAAKFGYPETIRTAVAAALSELIGMIENRDLPPPISIVPQIR